MRTIRLYAVRSFMSLACSFAATCVSVAFLAVTTFLFARGLAGADGTIASVPVLWAVAATITLPCLASFATMRLIADDPACAFLWDVARGRRIGADAETVLYRVERFAGAPYLARRMRVAAVVEEISAPPGETVTISGCFRQLGDAVEGTFDPETLAFTAA